MIPEAERAALQDVIDLPLDVGAGGGGGRGGN